MWEPMQEGEFELLRKEEESRLAGESKLIYDRFAVPTRVARMRRSIAAGEEDVFVVAASSECVLYYDDVEEGFNISPVDEGGKITKPGGSQMNLKDAVQHWLVDLRLWGDAG